MFDRGADPYELAQNAITSYQQYYLFNNFQRNRLGFNPDGYLDRITERYLDPLRTQFQFYVLNRSDLADEVPDDGTSTNFWHSPDGWGPYTVAVTDGFNLLGQILTTPEPGPYYVTDLADGRQAYMPDPYAVDPPTFKIDIPVGRYYDTEWDYNSGYYWYDRISHIGMFLDKVAALAQLTDPETDFLGADEAADVRQYAINYYRLFPNQMKEVWGAMLTDRWDRLAPVWDGTAIRDRPISGQITLPPQGMMAIDPQIDFTIELYSASLGMGLIPGTYDMSFTDSTRVYLDGSGQQLVTTHPTVSFADPLSGKSYKALSYKTGVIEHGIAARMIARANELAAMYTPDDPTTEAPLRQYVEVLDVVRSLTVEYADTIY
jgi:hypothetical protein